MKKLISIILICLMIIAAFSGCESTTPTPEPTPTATPEPENDFDSENVTVLKLGDTSEDVKKMQEKLIELNYNVSQATGYFGTETEAAVKAFQKNNGLEDDGIAGKGTLAKLYSGDAVAA